MRVGGGAEEAVFSTFSLHHVPLTREGYPYLARRQTAVCVRSGDKAVESNIINILTLPISGAIGVIE